MYRICISCKLQTKNLEEIVMSYEEKRNERQDVSERFSNTASHRSVKRSTRLSVC